MTPKTHKYGSMKKKRAKTLKLPLIIKENIASFFVDEFSSNTGKTKKTNGTGKLITTHRSYYPTQKRVIVIGDVHGDLDALIKSLLLAKVIRLPENEELPEYSERTNRRMYDFFHNIEWIGDDTFVVQLGDQIDRTRPVDWDENDVGIGNTVSDEGSSLHIFFLMWYLNNIAMLNGGRVISILGNHELMNVDGDFRYVSQFEFQEYYNAFSSYLKLNGDDSKINNSKNKLFGNKPLPEGYHERLHSFSCGNTVANFFGLNYKLSVQIGKWLFVHAGLTDNICGPNSICKINNSVSKYLLNYNSGKNRLIYKKIIECSGDKSPVWSRIFGDEETSIISDKYNNMIKQYNETNKKYHITNNIPALENIAIGHTPQFYANKKINSILDGRVWRCDIGMSRAFGNSSDNKYRQPQVLEILDDDIVNVLYS